MSDQFQNRVSNANKDRYVKVNNKEPWKSESSTQAAQEDRIRYFPFH